MKTEKTNHWKMNWSLSLAAKGASLMCLALCLMFLYRPTPMGLGSGSLSRVPSQWMSIFVGAADTALDGSMVVSKVAPTYPEIAKRMNISGVVDVAITVDESGKVTEATAINGPAMLRASAEAAVKQWTFKPGGGKGKISLRFGN